MSCKERVVFLDRSTFTADELPIPGFEHNWSEYPDSHGCSGKYVNLGGLG